MVAFSSIHLCLIAPLTPDNRQGCNRSDRADKPPAEVIKAPGEDQLQAALRWHQQGLLSIEEFGSLQQQWEGSTGRRRERSHESFQKMSQVIRLREQDILDEEGFLTAKRRCLDRGISIPAQAVAEQAVHSNIPLKNSNIPSAVAPFEVAAAQPEPTAQGECGLDLLESDFDFDIDSDGGSLFDLFDSNPPPNETSGSRCTSAPVVCMVATATVSEFVGDRVTPRDTMAMEQEAVKLEAHCCAHCNATGGCKHLLHRT